MATLAQSADQVGEVIDRAAGLGQDAAAAGRRDVACVRQRAGEPGRGPDGPPCGVTVLRPPARPPGTLSPSGTSPAATPPAGRRRVTHRRELAPMPLSSPRGFAPYSSAT